MVTVSYDRGNHPEYASNVYSQAHRIYKNNILMEINLSTKEIENLLNCLEVITGAIKLIDDGNKKYVVDCFNEEKLCISE